MNILIVGNVLKDVYLNLDERTENFETDRNGTRWLDLSFDASKHHFFNRQATFGGATVTSEVFANLGLKSQISGFDFSIDTQGFSAHQKAETYRYILVAGQKISYFSPTNYKTSTFTPPHDFCDFIYIDRSANLNAKTVKEILSYLKSSPKTKLVLYLKRLENHHLNQLISHSNFIFYENIKIDSPLLNPSKTVLLSENCFSYLDTKEYIANKRIDMLTHLSFYSIASATILGSFILGNSVKDSLNFARINVENSKLNHTLTLSEIKEDFNNSPSDNLHLLALNLILPPKSIAEFSDKKDFADFKKSANGIILTEKNLQQNQNIIDFLITNRLIPGINSSHHSDSNLTNFYNLGIRFAIYHLSANSDIFQQCQNSARFAQKCQLHQLVPVIQINSTPHDAQSLIHTLLEKMAEFNVDFSACLVKQADYKLLSNL
jgi:hypothetical protein